MMSKQGTGASAVGPGCVVLAAISLLAFGYCVHVAKSRDSGPTVPITEAARECDRAAASKVWAMVSDPQMASIIVTGGKVVVRWSNDYRDWDASQRRSMTQAVADADACLSGTARSIAFRSPDGQVVATADAQRGIQFLR